MQDRFYLVWNPASQRAPSYRHDTYAGAIKEARRLAGMKPNDEFIVLAALATARVRYPIEIRSFAGSVTVPGLPEAQDDGIPF